MKRYIITFVIIFLGLHTTVLGNNHAFQQGSQAYAKGDYATAIAKWQSILKDGQESGELYYNIGNAYYRMDDFSHAILNYERAKRLMPRDQDTRENLALAYSKTEDHIPQVPKFFLVSWWQGMVSLFSPHDWMWTSIILLVLTGAALVTFFLSRDFGFRKTSFIISMVLCVLLVFSFIFVALSFQNVSIHQEAVVMAPMTVVKSSPDQGGVDKFVLHEGTHLRLTDTEDRWTKIYIDDGNSGWLPNEDFEKI